MRRENRRLGFPVEAGTVSPTTVANWIRDHRFFIAILDGQVIGGGRLEVTSPDRMKLSRLAVLERWQSAVIGGTLPDHAERWVRVNGHTTV